MTGPKGIMTTEPNSSFLQPSRQGPPLAAANWGHGQRAQVHFFTNVLPGTLNETPGQDHGETHRRGHLTASRGAEPTRAPQVPTLQRREVEAGDNPEVTPEGTPLATAHPGRGRGPRRCRNTHSWGGRDPTPSAGSASLPAYHAAAESGRAPPGHPVGAAGRGERGGRRAAPPRGEQSRLPASPPRGLERRDEPAAGGPRTRASEVRVGAWRLCRWTRAGRGLVSSDPRFLFSARHEPSTHIQSSSGCRGNLNLWFTLLLAGIGAWVHIQGCRTTGHLSPILALKSILPHLAEKFGKKIFFNSPNIYELLTVLQGMQC